MFAEFRAKGLCVIPLKDGRPLVGWGQFFERLPDELEINKWPSADEYGLVCGASSNIVAVDIDTDDTARIEELAGISPVKKYGSKGFTAFYQYRNEQSQVWKDKQGVVICELLSNKRLTTIPPSPHRKTRKLYKWIGEAELGEVELPYLKDDFIALMNAKYPRSASTYKHIPYTNSNDHRVDLSEAEKMLSYLDPGCSRDEWVQIGMALRDEFGDAACTLWHNWSGASTKYNHNAAQSAWRSFTGNGVTIGTLIHFAKERGYIATRQTQEQGFEVDLSYLFPADKPKPSRPVPIKLSGLVGEIADWITTTAIRPQPVLSLAAALTFVGAMKGHRIRGHTDLRTNIMALSMAPTAAGKEHPQKSIDKLADAVGINVMGRPTSGTGLLTGLSKAHGIGLLTVDEMGRYIGNITMKSSQGYQREIADYMVELFSAASRTFRGRQYADEKANPQIVIQQPHFCCLGSTVPEKLQAACSSSEVIDGFLNRWLVFSSDDRPEKQKGVKFAPPPEELVNRIKGWLDAHPVKRDNYGTPEPQEIRFTPEAWEILEKFDADMMRKLDSEPYPVNQLYARSSEHAEKLAMVICDDDFIGTGEISTAITIVEQSNQQIALFAGSITDNQHESDVIFILDIIKKWPGISKSQITQRTRKINHRLRTDILNQLIDAGDIVPTEGIKGKLTFQAV